MGDVSKGEGKTVLFVSHNMAAVRELCSRSILLSRGTIDLFDNTENVISKYLSEYYTVKPYLEFRDEIVKNAKIEQDKNDLILTVNFDNKSVLDVPNLGFMIRDKFDNPIMGTNPIISKQSHLLKPLKDGKIVARIENARLVDGIYKISIWFGNSGQVFFAKEDCLSVEISNMVNIQYVNTQNIGAVAPLVNWQLTENNNL